MKLLYTLQPRGGLGGPTDDAVPVEISHMHVKLASYNALSLAEPCQRHKDQLHSAGLAFRVARPALLARCLEAAQVDIAAIQETRCGPGTLTTGPYDRVCAGSENGSFGTELWFKIGKPILRRGRSTICIQPHHIIVHHASPRRLLVSLEPGSSKLFILALHAPHRGAKSHTISTWWETTLSLCREFVRDAECIIAGDMNASIGSVCTQQVSDLAAEEEDLSGALLRQLMQQCGAWAPASFDSCHQGQSWTYRHKRNGRMIRPDLIAIPDGWWWGQVWSQVDVGIHAGQVSPDHYATTVEVRVNLRQKATCKRRASAHGRRYDVAAISKPENQGLVAEVFRSLPLVPWQVSAHTHAWRLVDHLQDNFQRLFPLTGRRARKKHSFLSDATWEIHAEVVRLRRACARCRTHETRHLLAAVLSVWRSQPGDQELDLRGAQLRAACVTDRAGYLADCAAQVAAGRDREAALAVRRLLGHKRKKPFMPDVLPSLLKKDGTVCATQQEVAARWQEHFGDLEAGVVSTAEQVVGTCLDLSDGLWPLPSDLLEMPSEAALARAIATAARHKTPGADGIPAEAGRCHPAILAERLYPLLMNIACAARRLPDSKAVPSSTYTKVVGRHFLQHSLPLHLGGKPGVPVSFAAHIVRGYLRWRSRVGATACVLFADISAAFYAAVRQLAAPVATDSLDRIFAGLQLHPGRGRCRSLVHSNRSMRLFGYAPLLLSSTLPLG